MDYKSHLASVTKKDRAQLLCLAMASLAVRGHERIGALGSPRQAAHGRVALSRVAQWVCQSTSDALPKSQPLQRRAAALLISDFLDPLEDLRRALTSLAATGIQGHIVQIADPAEEILPFDGRIEFKGLDMPATYLARKTENLRENYASAYQAHRNAVRDFARSLGWSFIVHRTDQSAVQCLLPLHIRVSGANNHAGRASA